MNTTNKQSGFAMIEIAIIAVLVIGILSFIGWTAYNSFHKPTTQVGDQTTSSSNSQPSKETSTATPTTPATPVNTSLDIKEFGLKVPLDSSISDATYSYDPSVNTNPTEAQIVSVTTKALTSASNNKCNLFEITKTQDQNIYGTPLVPNSVNTFKIGSYYYILSGIQSVCSTNHGVQQLLYQQQNTFAKDFKSAQPYN